MNQIGSSNHRYIKAKEEEEVGIFMIDVIMISKVIKIGTYQIPEKGEFNLVDKIEVD